MQDSMLFSRRDLEAWLESHPDIKRQIVIHRHDVVGFTADIGSTLKGERFDFPFDAEAFTELLTQEVPRSGSVAITQSPQSIVGDAPRATRRCR